MNKKYPLNFVSLHNTLNFGDENIFELQYH